MNPKPKDRNQHIKVFARVRPRNSQEIRSQIVVECLNTKEIVVKDKGQSKNFAFDRVFGPESKQVDVYKAVVAPMINEVLQGYNCTVFAYGQTGTGKTFTMVGDRSKDVTGGWQNDPLSGIVPRTLDHLFDELKVRAEEFTVRISFLELYNEELCDLLAPPDNDDTKTLRLFEDSMKKGSVIVSGLEERTVYEKNDVYPILEAGSLRRQTAPTLMNASSSRSHTIFTITVHVKVTTPEGEDLFKTGKLNLVDLAGSENIGRSGAVEMRAREAGNINQSLLTLGRVITSLVERTPHVPYRESKLTRILQDSLGGRTKTSIIATVSPAMCNLEETLSTFDYAHRARNITNKPEINQKMSKHVLLKNYTDEIERLRRDLMATREKHGVYLLSEDYNGMMSQIDNLNRDLVNKIQLLKVREDELAKQEEIMTSLNVNLYEVQSDLAKNKEMLQIREEALKERELALQELNAQAQLLLRTADEATEDSKRLHDRLDRARMVHSHNEELVDRFKSRFVTNLQGMKISTQAFQSRSAELTAALINLSGERTSECREHETALSTNIDQFLATLQDLLPDLSSRITAQIENAQPNLKLTTGDIQKVGVNLHELSSVMSSEMADWLAARGPAWQHLVSLIKDSQQISGNVGATVQDIRGCAQATARNLHDFQNEIKSTTQKEIDKLEKLNARSNEILLELESIRLEREKLLERERVALAALQETSAARAEEERRMGEAREKAAQVAADNSEETLKRLLQCLVSIENLNTALEKNTETIILPAVEQMREGELEEIEKSRGKVTEDLYKYQRKCQEIVDAQSSELAALDDVLAVGLTAQVRLSQTMHAFEQSAHVLADAEQERLTACYLSTLNSHRQLANETSDFCEQTFANIHDRCNELKVHFKEEFRRDEKTGNTPQRKDFQYPKRLVTAGKYCDGQENIPPPQILSQSQNNSYKVD